MSERPQTAVQDGTRRRDDAIDTLHGSLLPREHDLTIGFSLKPRDIATTCPLSTEMAETADTSTGKTVLQGTAEMFAEAADERDPG